MKKLAFASLLMCLSSSVLSDIGFVQWLEDGSSTELENMNCTDDIAPMHQGDFVYSISFCDKTTNVFKRLDDGSLAFVESHVNDAEQTGISPSESIAISPDDRHLYVAGRTQEGGSLRRAIFIYDIDSATGKLTQRGIFDDWDELGSDWQMLFSADGQSLYLRTVTGYIYVFSRAANGVLTRTQALLPSQIHPDFTRYQRSWMIQLSANDEELYLSNNPGYLIVFNRNASSGTLTYARSHDVSELANAPGYNAPNFVLSPSGTDIYAFVDESYSNSLFTQYALASDGSLSVAQVMNTFPDNFPSAKIYCPSRFLLSDNERLLYFIDSCGNSLQVWGRDELSGALSFFGAVKENQGVWDDRVFSQGNELRFSHDKYYLYGAMDDGIIIADVTADIELSTTVPTTIDISQQATLVFTLENHGPSTANRLMVDLDLGSFTVVSATMTGSNATCTEASNSVSCELPSLVDSAAQEIRVVVEAPALAETVLISGTASLDQLDKDTLNNAVSTSILVTDPTPTPEPEPGSLVDDAVYVTDGGGALPHGLIVLLMCAFMFRRRA